MSSFFTPPRLGSESTLRVPKAICASLSVGNGTLRSLIKYLTCSICSRKLHKYMITHNLVRHKTKYVPLMISNWIIETYTFSFFSVMLFLMKIHSSNVKQQSTDSQHATVALRWVLKVKMKPETCVTHEQMISLKLPIGRVSERILMWITKQNQLCCENRGFDVYFVHMSTFFTLHLIIMWR